jgi:hypothetical protein
VLKSKLAPLSITLSSLWEAQDMLPFINSVIINFFLKSVNLDSCKVSYWTDTFGWTIGLVGSVMSTPGLFLHVLVSIIAGLLIVWLDPAELFWVRVNEGFSSPPPVADNYYCYCASSILFSLSRSYWAFIKAIFTYF